MLELPNKNFKAIIIKSLQKVITNSPETNKIWKIRQKTVINKQKHKTEKYNNRNKNLSDGREYN